MPLLSARANKIAERHIIDNLGGIIVSKTPSVENNFRNISRIELNRKIKHWHPVVTGHFQMIGSFNGNGYYYNTYNKIRFTDINIPNNPNLYINYIPSLREFKVGLPGIYQINSHVHLTLNNPTVTKAKTAEIMLYFIQPYSSTPYSIFHLHFVKIYDIASYAGDVVYYDSDICLQGSCVAKLNQDTNLAVIFTFSVAAGGTNLTSADTFWSFIDFQLIKEEL